ELAASQNRKRHGCRLRFCDGDGWYSEMKHLAASVILLSATIPASAADPSAWATYRGNPQRTGNTDNQPGPAAPAVLWSVKSQDHFVASPAIIGDKLY